MGIRPATAFGCTYEYHYKPKQNIINIVKNIYYKMGIKRNYYIRHDNLFYDTNFCLISKSLKEFYIFEFYHH